MAKLSAGVVGGAGYTGGEMVRLLLQHPSVSLAFVSSRSQAGKALCEVHEDLIGQTELCFTDAYQTDVDIVFLCLPHGKAREFLQKVSYGPEVRIVDLSQDFRIAGPGNDFVYGLPELQRDRIRQAAKVANPGCFATAIQLALLPLAAAGQLNEDIHVSAITGSTGAGASLLSTTHFSWRNNNVSVYKAFTHQHLGEIGQSLRQLQPGLGGAVRFIPYRGNFSRGIIATCYTAYKGTADEAVALYREYYRDHPFVFMHPGEVHLKQVVNTNLCALQVGVHDGQLYVVSAIDNLLKGASGQAVQNMNLMMGWPETAGLHLKASVY